MEQHIHKNNDFFFRQCFKQHKHQQHKQKQGWTLLELLSCLSILALLCQVGLPPSLRYKNLVEYHTTAQALQQLAQSAQHHAQLSGQSTWLRINGSCLYWTFDTEHTCSQSEAVYLSSTMDIQTAWSTGQSIRFVGGRGQTALGSGSVWLIHQGFPDHHIKLVMSSLGRARLCQNSRLIAQVPLC